MMHFSQKIRIIIADNNLRLKEGLVTMLSEKPEFEILASYPNGLELLDSQILNSADVLLISIEMRHLNGIETGAKVRSAHPNLSMIALTMYQEKLLLKEIIDAGYKAFVYKPDIPEKLINTIHQVYRNEYSLPKELIENNSI